ncbi:hypothetical protein [Blastococcus saxobsidens]|uniref:hypothetical protein n=1 Tax=Blastococcus saxobsidens TaxID=138336 RepID=UPI001315295E|nr:hypothetical protein [Blastococcus saxobsidens]
MHTRPGAAPATAADRQQRLPSIAVRHVHWFRWSGADPFSGSSLYACRCGVVRPGL